jgi:hypothetical protein
LKKGFIKLTPEQEDEIMRHVREEVNFLDLDGIGYYVTALREGKKVAVVKTKSGYQIWVK